MMDYCININYIITFTCNTVSFTITFDIEGGNEITSVEVNNGKIIKLPEAQTKEGYKFVGWTNKDGNVITKDYVVTDNIVLKAMWIKKDAKAVTITFDTIGGSNIGSIVIESGKIIILPVNTTKMVMCLEDGLMKRVMKLQKTLK